MICVPFSLTMALAKIPMILIVTATSIKLITSPNTTPPKVEMASTTIMDNIGNQDIYLHLTRIGHILIGGAEIASILTAYLSSHPFSKSISSALFLRSGDAARIQMTAINALGATVFILGAIVRLRAFHDLGRFFRFNISIQKDHKLITTGLYAYVRHPSYTGLWIADIGWSLWIFGAGSWLRESGFCDFLWARGVLACFLVLVAFGPVMTVSRIEKEEMALKDKFGKEWDEWAKKVPYRLIPGVY